MINDLVKENERGMTCRMDITLSRIHRNSASVWTLFCYLDLPE